MSSFVEPWLIIGESKNIGEPEESNVNLPIKKGKLIASP